MLKLFEFDEHIGDWRVLVQTKDIRNGAITTQLIAPGAVTGDKIGDREVKSRNIAERAIDGNHIKDKAIGPEHLQKEIVESRHIMPGSVDITKIKPGTLDGQTVVLNSNMLAVKMKPNGVLVAYYGNLGQIKGVRSDERGHCYLQYEMEVVKP